VLSADNPYYRQVLLLVEILPLVAKESCFALKGGTAINLFIRDLPRLSVDIDLTYVPIAGRDESLMRIDESLRRIGAAIERTLRGVTVVYQLRGGQLLTKLLARRAREQVQIEVSPVLRGTVHTPELRDVSAAVAEQFGAIRMPVLHTHELYAGKLCAALDRQHPRDLFDVMQLQRAEGISRELFNVFLVYMLSGDRPIAEMIAPRLMPLFRAFNAEFTGMTLVPISLEALEAARTKLIEDLRVMLIDADRHFLLSVKQGQPDWQAFAYPAARHLPAIQWKLQNIARMTVRKRAEAIARLEAVFMDA
jgi:predicted nucleotidyltransferase component of viral defense system